MLDLRIMKKKKVLIRTLLIIAVNLFIGCKTDPWRTQSESNSSKNLLIKKIPQILKKIK
ncbi:hypothetical protein JOE44_001502 [Chryseobacterium sp. PvR013]|jgi:hypothetical protein|nr:hypothetical protein [Chryseobacterium sp. PvR013]MDR6461575.1 hypothetical protein [Chryseobacterium sediminis]